MKLAQFYGVSVDYLLGLTNLRKQSNTPLESLHLSDEAVELLSSGKLNARLLSELIAHKDFLKLMADIEIYVDAIASMLIKNLNSYVDFVRNEIIEKYHPEESDPTLNVLRAAHVREDEFFNNRIAEDLFSIVKEIRKSHAQDKETAPDETAAENIRQAIEDAQKFNGNPLERQAMIYLKQLGINYSKLTPLEFQQFINILKKSSLLKTGRSGRKKKGRNGKGGSE